MKKTKIMPKLDAPCSARSWRDHVYFEDEFVTLLVGDVREILPLLPEGVAQCSVSSPPYWGLRDYGTAEWEGGDANCDHQPPNDAPNGNKGQPVVHAGRFNGDCRKCGAVRIDAQIGLEKTPAEFVENMVGVVYEGVKRVMKESGIALVNLGDSYWGSGKGMNPDGTHSSENKSTDKQFTNKGSLKTKIGKYPDDCGLKPKDLCGIPWRVALAMQDRGWWWRQWFPWVKRNPMPGSQTDRATTATEVWFQFTKSKDYFYDEHSTRSFRNTDLWFESIKPAHGLVGIGDDDEMVGLDCILAGFSAEFCTACGRYYHDHRDKKEIVREKISDKIISHCICGETGSWLSHCATFPQRLIEPLIKCATSENGQCSACGKAWVRKTETAYSDPGNRATNGRRSVENREITAGYNVRLEKTVQTLGWSPQCDCNADTEPQTVLDPFSGSGTTMIVAAKLGRRCIAIELNKDYARMSVERYKREMNAPVDPPRRVETMPLFATGRETYNYVD